MIVLIGLRTLLLFSTISLLLHEAGSVTLADPGIFHWIGNKVIKKINISKSMPIPGEVDVDKQSGISKTRPSSNDTLPVITDQPKVRLRRRKIGTPKKRPSTFKEKLDQRIVRRRKKAQLLKKRREKARAARKVRKKARLLKLQEKRKQKSLLLKRRREKAKAARDARKASRKAVRQLRRKHNKNKKKRKLTSTKSEAKQTNSMPDGAMEKLPQDTSNTLRPTLPLHTDKPIINIFNQNSFENHLGVSGSILIEPSQMHPFVFTDNLIPNFEQTPPDQSHHVLDQQTLENMKVDQNHVPAELQFPLQADTWTHNEPIDQNHQTDIKSDLPTTRIEPVPKPNLSQFLSNGEKLLFESDQPVNSKHSSEKNSSVISDLHSNKMRNINADVLPNISLSDINKGDSFLHNGGNDIFPKMHGMGPVSVVSFQDVNIGPNGSIIFINESNESRPFAGQKDFNSTSLADKHQIESVTPSDALNNTDKLLTGSSDPLIPAETSPTSEFPNFRAKGGSFLDSILQEVRFYLRNPNH